MSRRVAMSGFRGARVLLAMTALFLRAPAAPAAAVEATAPAEEGPAPGVEEIGQQNDIANQYRPEQTELPPFQRFLYVPMVIAGILIVVALLLQYLRWQPRFAEERRTKRRR